MTGAQEREIQRMKKRHSNVTWVEASGEEGVQVTYTVRGLHGDETKTILLAPNGLPA